MAIFTLNQFSPGSVRRIANNSCDEVDLASSVEPQRLASAGVGGWLKSGIDFCTD
jgi:hypothetical protein